MSLSETSLCLAGPWCWRGKPTGSGVGPATVTFPEEETVIVSFFMLGLVYSKAQCWWFTIDPVNARNTQRNPLLMGDNIYSLCSVKEMHFKAQTKWIHSCVLA